MISLLTTLLFEPPLELKLAIFEFIIQMGIDTLDLIDNPLMDTLILTFLENHIFQHLEILGDRCLMAIDTVLQFGNGTNGFALTVYHCEGLGDLANLQRAYHASQFGGQGGNGGGHSNGSDDLPW